MLTLRDSLQASVLAFSLLLPALAAPAGVLPKLRATNLVADQPNTAKTTDANLVNPWGVAYLPTGPFWVADNATGKLTLYLSNGGLFPTTPSAPLVVTVPTPPGVTGPAAPTGLVANTGPGFVVAAGGQSGPSLFVTVTENGTIAGWSPAVDLTHAILAVDQSQNGAVYKGAALASDGSETLLFVTDFRNGLVDVFDSSFQLVNTFTDPKLPSHFAPFGIANVEGRLVVTFAKQELPDREDDQAGPGNGFVDVFAPSGRLLQRLVAGKPLDSPWGIALTPKGFRPFGRALLIGNFGDGRIHAFDPENGRFLGTIRGADCKPLIVDGLWSLTFGNDFEAGEPDILYFAAGPDDESHGIFGKLKSGFARCHAEFGHDREAFPFGSR